MWWWAAAHAAPVNPWGGATGADHAWVAAYAYLYPDGTQTLGYGGVGWTDPVDLVVGVGALDPRRGPRTAAVEVFPRWFVAPGVAVVAHAWWTPGVAAVDLAPEVHATRGGRGWSVVVNAGWRATVGDGASAGRIPLIVAPELHPTERWSVFVEVDPTVPLSGDPAALVVVPGFSAALDADGRHALAVGLQTPVLPEVGAAAPAASYTYSFSTR